MKDLLQDCKHRLKKGENVDSILHTLRDRGLTKVQSIKALVDLGYAPLDKAKKVVHNSSTWVDTFERDEEFHENLERTLRKD